MTRKTTPPLFSPKIEKLGAELAKRHDPVINPDPKTKQLLEQLGKHIASDARIAKLIDKAITNRHKPKKD